MTCAPHDLTLPARLAEGLAAELQPGERVVWCAQPRPDLFVRNILLVSLLLGVGMVTTLPLFLIFLRDLLRESRLVVTALLLAEVPAVGVAIALPLALRRRARRTAYVVTDRRAILLTRGLRRRVLSFGPEQLRHMHVKRRPDGCGDIFFTHDFRTTRRHGVTWAGVGFVAIDNVVAVHRLLKDLAAGLAAPAATSAPSP